MRLPFRHRDEQTWDVNQFVWLENTSDKHVLLQLPSGELRLDKGRKLRFRPDVLTMPQVADMVNAGSLVVHQ